VTLRSDIDATFRVSSQAVFRERELTVKTKQLIAPAAAHVKRRPHCSKGDTRAASRFGSTSAEIAEQISVGGEMRERADYGHGSCLNEMEVARDAGQA